MRRRYKSSHLIGQRNRGVVILSLYNEVSFHSFGQIGHLFHYLWQQCQDYFCGLDEDRFRYSRCCFSLAVNHLLSNQHAFSSYPKKLILKICSSQNNISHYNHHRPLSFDFLNLIQRSSVLFFFVWLCKFRNINRTL